MLMETLQIFYGQIRICCSGRRHLQPWTCMDGWTCCDEINFPSFKSKLTFLLYVLSRQLYIYFIFNGVIKSKGTGQYPEINIA